MRSIRKIDPKTFDQRMGKLVRQYREGLGKSQADLADSVSRYGPRFTDQTVAKIERGERSVKYEEAIALALALEVDMYKIQPSLTPEDNLFYPMIEAQGQFDIQSDIAVKALQALEATVEALDEADLAIMKGLPSAIAEGPQSTGENISQEEHVERLAKQIERLWLYRAGAASLLRGQMSKIDMYMEINSVQPEPIDRQTLLKDPTATPYVLSALLSGRVKKTHKLRKVLGQNLEDGEAAE